MARKLNGIELTRYDDLFKTDAERETDHQERVQIVPAEQVFPYARQPYSVDRPSADLVRLMDSIERTGIAEPLIVRPRSEGGYEIISGHRRDYCAKVVGLDTRPVIVRNYSDEDADILVVDYNINRENLLPSEKAKAYRDTPLTLADERIARAIRENNARLVIIDPVQAFLGADVDMNRANEVRPIFRSLGDIAQATGCAIVLIGHLNKAAGTQSTYRGLGSIDITAAVRSLLFIGKLKDSPTTRVLIHEKSSLAPPGQSLAFSLGDEKGFEWIGAYDITADELLTGTDTAKTESKTAQAQMLILELLADGKRMPSAELEKAVNERGISSRTMRTAKSRIGDRLVTEKEGTAWVCYLRN